MAYDLDGISSEPCFDRESDAGQPRLSGSSSPVSKLFARPQDITQVFESPVGFDYNTLTLAYTFGCLVSVSTLTTIPVL